MEESLFLQRLSPAERESLTKIVNSLASRYSITFPFLSFDDLVQEAWRLLSDEAWTKHYDPTKGTKPTTWFFGVLTRFFTSYAQREYNKTQKWNILLETDGVDEASEEFVSLPVEPYSDLMESLSEILSPYANKLMLMLNDNPTLSNLDLTKQLNITLRDFSYVQDELRSATRFLLK